MSLQVWLPLTKDLRNQGLANVAITNNGATFESAGKLGGCYYLNGSTSSYINTNYSTNIGTSDFSIALWIKIPTISSGDYYAICSSKGGVAATSGFGIYWNYTQRKFLWSTADGSSATEIWMNDTVDSIVYNNWIHLVMIRNSNDSQKGYFYINGIRYELTSIPVIRNITTATNMLIGKTSTDHYPTKMYINDFRIYNHALSEQEVKKLSQGLMVHYPLNRNGWGQENLIPNSTTKTSSGYNVSNWTCTANTSVSNWGCTDAYRCTGSGGTNTIIGTLGIGQPSNSNFTYSYSVWVKNNHSTNKIAFSTNHAGYYSEWLSPGQAKRLTVEGAPGNGSSYIQLNWRTNIVGEAFDFSYWRPKIEIGNKVTPWTPGSSDLLAGIELNNTTEYDISGFGNNGIRVGTFEWSSDTPKYNVSIVFNASHPDYIKIPYTNYAVQGAKEMTWSIWAYDDDWSTYSGRIYSCTEGGGVNIEDGGSTLNWAVNMYTAADYSTYAYQGYCSISKASLSSGWHMFTWVYTTTGTKVYVDGVLKSTIDINSYGIHFANTALYLGAEAQGETTSTGYYLTGKLSDFRIYATALSANDVKSLYQNCATIGPDGTIYGKIRN